MAEILRQLFLNPAMLAGTALVSVPIIIYLINRQRFQRRRWAAMEFLLRAMKRNRRRIQLQSLLLLLIRCAIIFLLALALARPIQRRGAISAAPDASQNWVLAIDDSYSMGFREDSRSLLLRAKETVAQMFDGLIKPGDQVAVATIGKAPRAVVPPTRVNDSTRASILREVEEIALSTGAVDLGASFQVLDEVASKFLSPIREPEPKQVVVFSDLQRKDWVALPASRAGGGGPAPGEGPRDPSVLPILDKIQKEGGSFLFARLTASDRRSNLAITDLSATPSLIARDVWVELRATVRNFGDEEVSGADLTIQVDRDPADAAVEPQLGEVIRVPAGDAVTGVLPFKFTTPGFHTVVAELRSDGLVIDNKRYLVVPVAESIKVLLVDGDPASNPLERETFHLEAALEPEDDSFGVLGGRFTPFEAAVVTPSQVGEVDIKGYSVVVLANVAELPLDRVEEIKRYVRSGGALMVFLGPNVRADFYNQFLRGAEGEEGLLPGVLEEARGDERYPVHLRIADPAHPVTRYFEERRHVTHIDRPVISFYKYFRVAGLGEPGPGVRVFLSYSDTDASPAAFDNAFGAGRVLWFTSTADQGWNELSNWPDYVVFLYESISYLVGFGMSSSNLRTGDVFRRTYPASQYASEVMLLAPEPESDDLDRVRSVRKAMRSLPGGSEFDLSHEETEVPGLYRLDLLRPSSPGTDGVEYFAVNLDTSESDLRPMTIEDFRAHYQGLAFNAFDASERLRVAKGERELLSGREFARAVLFAVLALAAAETVLAWLFGRRAAR
jgi:hypothetical protein